MLHFRSRWLQAAAITLSCAFAGFAAAPAQATTTLVINQLLPPGDAFNQQVLRPWAQDVQKVTQGRVLISLPGAPVAPPNQLWNAVTGGIVDGAYVFNGLLPHQLPLEQVAALPFIGGDAAQTSVALWNTHEKFFAKAGEYRNVKLLALFSLPAGEIFSLGKPVVQPADLAGRRMWVMPGVPQQVLVHSAAGVVSSPAVQLSELVAGGTVDSFAGMGDYNAKAFKVIGYVKSETLIPGGLSVPSFSLVINKARWESISPADRKAIESISGLAFAQRMKVMTELNVQSREQAARNGVHVVQASPALITQLKAYAQPLVQQWLAEAHAKGVDGPAALQYFQAQAQAH